MTSSTEPSDEVLVARNDLVGLYHRYARRLVGFLRSRGAPRSDLADLHQEVWARVWQRLQQGPAFEGHFRGWLFTIARNLAIDQGRRSRQTEPITDALVARTPLPVDVLCQQEEESRLRHCLDRLKEQEAAVVRGRLGGEAHEQISQRLGVSVDRVYRLFHDARQALARCLERSSS